MHELTLFTGKPEVGVPSLATLTSPTGVRSQITEAITARLVGVRDALGTTAIREVHVAPLSTKNAPLYGDSGKVDCRAIKNSPCCSVLSTLISDCSVQGFTAAFVSLGILPNMESVDLFCSKVVENYQRDGGAFIHSSLNPFLTEQIHFRIRIAWKAGVGMMDTSNRWLNAVEYELLHVDEGAATLIDFEAIIKQVRVDLPEMDLRTYAERDQQLQEIGRKYCR